MEVFKNTREIIKIDTDQIVETEGHHTEEEVSMDKIIEEDHIMSIIIEMTIEETILEICKIIDVKMLEVDIEEIIEITTLGNAEIGIEKDSIQIILAEMRKVVVVGVDWVQELVLIYREFNAISVGNMIILLRTVHLHR